MPQRRQGDLMSRIKLSSEPGIQVEIALSTGDRARGVRTFCVLVLRRREDGPGGGGEQVHRGAALASVRISKHLLIRLCELVGQGLTGAFLRSLSRTLTPLTLSTLS